MSSTPVTAAARSQAIDLMRGLSMLYIVGYWHLFNYTKAFPAYFNGTTVRLTVVILGLFTLVSGYLTGQKPMRLARADVTAYYRSRFLRIYPPFLGALLVFFALRWMTAGTLLKSALLVAMFWGPPPPTLWFITMIVCCYALAPLLIHLRERQGRGFIALCVLIEAALAAYIAAGAPADLRMWMYFPCFALGVWLGGVPPGRLARLLPLAVGATAAGLALSWPETGSVEQSFRSMPLALGGALLVFIALMGPWLSLQRLPAVIGYLSFASYFMYLLHRPLYAAMSRLLQWAHPASGMVEVAYLMGVCLPIVVAVAWRLQRLYDGWVARVDSRRALAQAPR